MAGQLGQESALKELHPASAGDAAILLSFPRIEYGKFTLGNGIAEIMEHRILARSPEFPDVLRSYCGPRTIGPSIRDQDNLPDWAAHGTVLLPVSTDEGIVGIFARVRPLPEGSMARDYQRARFLTVPPEADPLTMLDAMNCEPLEGLTVEETDAAAQPIRVGRRAPSSRSFDPKLLNTALQFILAGIPVAITREIREDVFFDYAAAIWRALPSSIRPWFSAGWGVATSLSGQLAFSAGLSGDNSCARFNPDTSQWVGPAECDETERELAEGYLKVIFRGDAAANPAHQDRMKLVDRLCSGYHAPKGILRWSDERVIGMFQSVGRAASDAWRLDKLRSTLGNQDGDVPEPEKLEESMWFPRSLNLAVGLMAGALDSPQTERKAARALGRWVSRKPDFLEYLKQKAPTAHGKVCQFVDICLSDPVKELESLLQGSSSAAPPLSVLESEALSVAIRNGLARFTPQQAELHKKLLQLPVVPELYWRFLTTSAWDLALAFDQLSIDTSLEPLEALNQKLESPLIRHLTSLATYQKPSPDTAKEIREKAPEGFEAFQKQIRLRWNRLDALLPSDQDALLEWALEMTVPDLPVVTAVRLSREGKTPLPFDSPAVKHIGREVTVRRIPPAAEEAIADVARRQLNAFLPEILHWAHLWRNIARYWPPQMTRLLGVEPVAAEGLTPELDALEAASIEELLVKWTDDWGSFLKDRGVARDLLILSCRVTDRDRNKAPMAFLCRRLDRERLTNFKYVSDYEIEELQRVAKLVRASGIEFTKPALREAWSTAENNLALLLLLLLRPDEDFQPSLKQLELLSEVGDALKDHLLDHDTPTRRRWAFQLAAAGFHEFPYSAKTHPLPKRRIADLEYTPLWAAFSGVPISEQSDLDIALRHYAARFDKSERDLRTIGLCNEYLDGMASRQEYSELKMAALRVQDKFINKIIDHDLLLYDRIEQFRRMLSEYSPTGRVPPFDIVEQSERGLVGFVLNGAYSKFQIYRGFLDLIIRVRKLTYTR